MSYMIMLPIFFVVLALVIALYALIGVFVYRDARRRDMNAPLWTIVAVLVPSFIGLIVYLLARNSLPEGSQCAQCGASVSETFLVCPKCGAQLSIPCPACGKQVSREWSVCPYCKAELPAPQQVLKKAGRMHPALIAAIIALVVLVFAALAVTLFILPGAIFNAPHSAGVSIASVQNNSESRLTGSFGYRDGTETKALRLTEGQTLTLKSDIEADSGNIKLEILDPAGTVLKTCSGISRDVITVKAEKTGDYTIKVTMTKCKGHYDISWGVD